MSLFNPPTENSTVYKLEEENNTLRIEVSKLNAELVRLAHELNTTKKLLEEDLTYIMQEKQRAEMESRAKSDFLAAISHEIRTPLNVILGMSFVMSRTNLSVKHQKYFSDIQAAANALMAIIDDILDLSKIGAGKMEVVDVSYSLKIVLDNLKSMFSELCRQKQLDLRFNIRDNLPDNVYGDENKVRQVLTNILSNAAKYTYEGEILLDAWLDDENYLCFDIKDTGIGIRDEDIGRLFLPFEQMDKHKNRNISGTGLGLAIASSFCELMNGSIVVDSVYGKGTTFSVRIPYLSAIESTDELQAAITDFIAPAAKVLVVDDIEINLVVAESMLEIFNIVPDLVESGADAIELARRNKYDIIFMDHMMPDMDGLEATRAIRGICEHNSKVPIVALTANVVKESVELFLCNRIDDVLPKPIDLIMLNLCLRKWLPQEIIKEVVY